MLKERKFELKVSSMFKIISLLDEGGVLAFLGIDLGRSVEEFEVIRFFFSTIRVE